LTIAAYKKGEKMADQILAPLYKGQKIQKPEIKKNKGKSMIIKG